MPHLRVLRGSRCSACRNSTSSKNDSGFSGAKPRICNHWLNSSQGLHPKLLESEVEKVKNRTKEFGHAYSLFLLAHTTFKTKKSEREYYQELLILLTDVIERVFPPEDFFELKKGNFRPLLRDLPSVLHKHLQHEAELPIDQAQWPAESTIDLRLF